MEGTLVVPHAVAAALAVGPRVAAVGDEGVAAVEAEAEEMVSRT